MVREFCYKQLELKQSVHQKIAKYYVTQRNERLEAELEDRIFYHLTRGQENEKINEIKEFLTLTSQNTESFFDADHSNAHLHKTDTLTQSKYITDFAIVRGLGKGAFGQVYMVRDKSKSNY